MMLQVQAIGNTTNKKITIPANLNHLRPTPRQINYNPHLWPVPTRTTSNPTLDLFYDHELAEHRHSIWISYAMRSSSWSLVEVHLCYMYMRPIQRQTESKPYDWAIQNV